VSGNGAQCQAHQLVKREGAAHDDRAVRLKRSDCALAHHFAPVEVDEPLAELLARPKLDRLWTVMASVSAPATARLVRLRIGQLAAVRGYRVSGTPAGRERQRPRSNRGSLLPTSMCLS
jgi:hypothetical protein